MNQRASFSSLRSRRICARRASVWALLGVFALLVAPSPVAAKGDRLIRRHALTVAMGGHEIGTLVGSDFETEHGFVFERSQDLVLMRGDTELKIHVESRSEVDRALNPIRSRFVKNDGSGRQVMTTKAENGELKVEISQSGTTVRKAFPLVGGLTYYTAMEHEVRENLRDGFAAQRGIFVEEMGGVFKISVKTRAVDGAFESEIAMENLKTIERYDARGNVLSSTTPAIGSVAWPIGAPRPKGVSAGRGDIMGMTTWQTEPLRGDESSIRYRVWVEKPRSFEVPEDSRQQVVNRTDRYLEIVVAGERSTQGGLAKATRSKLLSSTQYEAIEDPQLISTAADVVKGATSTAEKIKMLVAFVHQHVGDHALDRAYAPAVTTLREKKGDCTEKSVLLSALLRTQGIPTRLVEGVVVSGDILGYHEWVEAQVDDIGFFPADPTFGEFPASVARLKLVQATSDPEGILKFGLSASRFLRKGVKIEIVETIPRRNR